MQGCAYVLTCANTVTVMIDNSPITSETPFALSLSLYSWLFLFTLTPGNPDLFSVIMVLPAWECHMNINGALQYVAWKLASLTQCDVFETLKSLCVSAAHSLSLWGSWHSPVWPYQSLLIRLPGEGHSACFHCLVIRNKIAIYILVPRFCVTTDLHSLDKHPGMELLA